MSDTTTAAAPQPFAFASMFLQPEALGQPELLAIYGPHGRWKTSIAAGIANADTFADKKVLMIDIDKGSQVLANNPQVAAKIADGTFNIIPLDKTAPGTFTLLCQLLGYPDGNGNWIAGEAFKQDYDVIILDTLDVAQDVATNYYTHNTLNDRQDAVDTRKGWGLVGDWTLGVAWAMKNSAPLGIMLIHSTEETDAGKFVTKPSLAGRAQEKLAAIPDLVAYVDFEVDPNDKDKTQLVATIGESATHETKNRWMLPAKVPNFTLPLLYDMIAQNRNNNATPAATAA